MCFGFWFFGSVHFYWASAKNKVFCYHTKSREVENAAPSPCGDFRRARHQEMGPAMVLWAKAISLLAGKQIPQRKSQPTVLRFPWVSSIHRMVRHVSTSSYPPPCKVCCRRTTSLNGRGWEKMKSDFRRCYHHPGTANQGWHHKQPRNPMVCSLYFCWERLFSLEHQLPQKVTFCLGGQWMENTFPGFSHSTVLPIHQGATIPTKTP